MITLLIVLLLALLIALLAIMPYLAIVFGFSWAVTCGVLWLAAWCFGLVFDLKIATGIWLIIFLIIGLFKAAKSDE